MLPSKWENLICSTKLIHVCKKTTTCIGLQTKQIFKYLIYNFFFNLDMAFMVPFLCYIPEASASGNKKILK